MQNVIAQVREYFLQEKDHIQAFIENDTRVESWSKAELLVLFTRLKKEKIIDAFEREPNFYTDGTRNQIDFSITINGLLHLVELKALCISQSKGTPRNLHFYFRDDNVGLIKDFKKLERLNALNKWIIAFVYPKPSNAA